MSALTASTVYPDSQLVRDSVELVGIDEQQLIDHEKELVAKRKQAEKDQAAYLKGEARFIEKQEVQTAKDLQ